MFSSKHFLWCPHTHTFKLLTNVEVMAMNYFFWKLPHLETWRDSNKYEGYVLRDKMIKSLSFQQSINKKKNQD